MDFYRIYIPSAVMQMFTTFWTVSSEFPIATSVDVSCELIDICGFSTFGTDKGELTVLPTADKFCRRDVFIVSTRAESSCAEMSYYTIKVRWADEYLQLMIKHIFYLFSSLPSKIELCAPKMNSRIMHWS